MKLIRRIGISIIAVVISLGVLTYNKDDSKAVKTQFVEAKKNKDTSSKKKEKNDKKNDKKYIIMGSDFSDRERDNIYSNLGLKGKKGYKVIKISNKNERKYYKKYLSKSVLGKRAILGVRVTKQEDGRGVCATSSNTDKCDAGGYRNIAMTLGMEDTRFDITAPVEVSGYTAIVYMVKGYKELTGIGIGKDRIDIAIRELIYTSDLGMLLENMENAETLVAWLKNEVCINNMITDGEMNDSIDYICEQLGIKLNKIDDQKELQQTLENIRNVMGDISEIGIDAEYLKNASPELLNKIETVQEDNGGMLGKMNKMFNGIFDKVIDIIQPGLYKMGINIDIKKKLESIN